MSYLNQWDFEELDTWSMEDMTVHLGDGTVIDEIYIDPVTTGIDMHFYYSTDMTQWEDKLLGLLLPRHYIAKKGFHSLPSPTFIKFFKIEFSNLAAAPYQAAEYPNMRPITYRKYPTWVENFFHNSYIMIPEEYTAYQVHNATSSRWSLDSRRSQIGSLHL